MSAAGNFPNGMPGEPVVPSSAPYARSGKAQPRSGGRKLAKPRKVTVRRHTRTVKPKAPAPKAPAIPSDQALINAAIRTHFAPQEQALSAQLNQNARFRSGTNDWYLQAQNDIKGLRDQGNAAAQQTLGRITAYNSQPTLANANDQQAAGARNNLNSEYAAMFGRDATANSDAMNQLAAAYAIQQGNTQNATNAQRMGLLGQQGQLGQQKADYGLTYGAQLQSAEQKAQADALKTQLAAKALGIKVDTLNKVQIPLAKSLAGDRKAGQKVARTNARTQRVNAQEKQRHDAQMEALGTRNADITDWKAHHPNAGKEGAGSNSTYSKSKIQGFRQNWDYAKATAHQLRAKKTYTDKSGKVQNISTDVAYSALLNAVKDPDIAKAASLAAFGKPIPGDLRHRLAVKGIHVADPKVGRVTGGGPWGTGKPEN